MCSMCWLTFLAISLTGSAHAAQDVWLIGIFPFTGGDYDGGLSQRFGAQIMLDEINKHTSLLPGYNLKVVWLDGKCSKKAGSTAFYEALFEKKYVAWAPDRAVVDMDTNKDGAITTSETDPYNKVLTGADISPDPVGLLGSGCAGTAMGIAEVASLGRWPTVSHTATRPALSDRTQYPNFWRTIMPDTFFNEAWLAMAKMLGQTSVVPVIGETDNWGSMGVILAAAAVKLQIVLQGYDHTSEISGFNGLQMSIDSKSLASTVAADLVRLKTRVVILMMFGPRNRLLLCAAFQKGFRNAVYMGMGWLPNGWWAKDTTDCKPAEITSMASGFIGANMMFWRNALSTKLACSETMTAGQFKTEWFARQGAADGDMSNRPEGYFLTAEAATTADAVCMWAKMLHEMLIVRSTPLADLSARTATVYQDIQDLFAATDFEGVTGRLRFGPGEADPKGSIVMQQLQLQGSGRRLDSGNQGLAFKDMGSYTDGVFAFFGKDNFVFQYAGESFLPVAGSTSLSFKLTDYKTCPENERLDFLANTCVGCPKGQVVVAALGVCICSPGQKVSAGSCAACPVGKYSLMPGSTNCTDCSPGKYSTSIGRGTQCDPCAMGHFQQGSGKTACSVCAAGSYALIPGSPNCTLCRVGRSSSVEGLSERCKKCPVGYQTSSAGETACTACTPGKYSSFTPLGERTCSECSSGRFSATTANSECQRCPLGRFAESTGSTACSSCQDELLGATTPFQGSGAATDCVCEEGSYMPSEGHRCAPCPLKMSCPTGSKESNVANGGIAPRVDAGYWSSVQGPLSVFACSRPLDCPGGAPAFCHGRLTGRACSLCPKTMAMVADGDTGKTTCERCNKASGTIIVGMFGLVLAGVLIISTAHIFVNKAQVKLARTTMTGVFLGGMAVTELLRFNIYGKLDNVWSPPLSDLFGWLAFLKFDFVILAKFSCIIGQDSRVALYAFKLLVIPCVFMGLCFGLALLHPIAFMHPYLAMNKDAIFNSMGLFFSIVFITVCDISLDGLTCSGNPNGQRTLTSDRSILCWESEEHIAYVVLSILAILAYPVLFLAMAGLVIKNYDAWAIKGGPPFIVRVRFLVSRMHPDMLFFSFWYNIRNFSLALVPGVLSTNFSMQVLGLLAISLGWLVAQIYFLPWRFPILNYFDSFASAANTLLLACFMMMSRSEEQLSVKAVGWIIVTIFLLVITSLIIAGTVKLGPRCLKRKEYCTFLCHSKTGAGLTARLVKIMLIWMTSRKCFLDVDELDNLDNLNFTVRTNTDNFIILLTKETFYRFWCALEMTSAFWNKVPTAILQIRHRHDDQASDPALIVGPVIDEIGEIWGPMEMKELHKQGVEIVHVIETYRHVSMLRVYQYPLQEGLQIQMQQVREMVARLANCPMGERQTAAELGQSLDIVYDTQSTTQACVANIMHLLLKAERWYSRLCCGLEACDGTAGAAALVLISKNLAMDAVSIGFVTELFTCGIPIVTVVSQESFPESNKDWINKLRNGSALSSNAMSTVLQLAPGSSHDAIANSQEALTKILAWRFTPQETETVMMTEFTRILDRAKVALKRPRTSYKGIEVSQQLFRAQVSQCAPPDVDIKKEDGEIEDPPMIVWL